MSFSKFLFLMFVCFSSATSLLRAQPKPTPTVAPEVSPTPILQTSLKVRTTQVEGISPQTEIELDRATKLMQDGKHEEAVAAHTKTIKTHPNIMVAYNNRGYSLMQLGNLDEAIEDFNRALKLSPTAITYDNRGMAFLKKGDLVKALADVSKAVELNPQSSLSYSNRAMIYTRGGKLDLALSDLNKAISIQPKEASYLSNRCYVNLNLNLLEQALKDCTDALGLNPKNVLAYGNRGAVYLRLSSFESALADYDAVVKLPGGDTPENYFNSGFVLTNLNRPQEAVESFTKSIALRPLALAYIHRAKAYEKLEQFAAELADYNKVIELEPTNSIAFNNRGIYYFKRGDHNAALADFSRAIELNPRAAQAYRNRAVLYRKIDKSGKAQADEKTAAALEAAPLK